MTERQFRVAFSALARTDGHFPWQWVMYQRFLARDVPSSCNLPTLISPARRTNAVGI